MYAKLLSEVKLAMKTKDISKRDVLKQVQMKAQAIAKETNCEIDGIILTDAINKELKQLNQTKDTLAGKEDCDLYKSTIVKMEILQKYLPEQLSEEGCKTLILEILSGVDASLPKGKKIGLVMKEMKGKADNNLIKTCLDALIQ